MTKVGRKSLSRLAAVGVMLVACASTVLTARADNDGTFVGGLSFGVWTGLVRADTAAGTLHVVDADVQESPGTQQIPPAAQGEPERLHIEYVPPKKPALQKTYEAVKERRVLERIKEIFSPFRLEEDLYIKALECDGKPNTYFEHEGDRPIVKLCYEYLKAIHDKMPKKPTNAGVTPREVMVGQFLFAAAHELGHALFEIYNIPIFGRQEDAADQFATYFILQFGGDRARRMILGAAYSYRGFVKQIKGNPKVTLPLATFSSDHGQPEQRFYNLICIAYGYDAKLFTGAVEKKYLPLPRAKVCNLEYGNLRYAVKTLIDPHIDPALAQKVIDTGFSPSSDPVPPAKSAPHAPQSAK
jgi:hypothetical protein